MVRRDQDENQVGLVRDDPAIERRGGDRVEMRTRLLGARTSRMQRGRYAIAPADQLWRPLPGLAARD